MKLGIVKRRGHTEPFDERKIYGSCYFACMNAHLGVQESEKICGKVCASIKKKIGRMKTVSSDQIFSILIAELKKHNEDAAFLFETHRDIS